MQIDRSDTEATVRVEGEAVRVVPGLSLPVVVVVLTGPVDRFTPGGG